MNIKPRSRLRIAVKQRLQQGDASFDELMHEAAQIVPFANAIREYNDHLERTRLYHAKHGKPVKNTRTRSVEHQRYHGLKYLLLRVLWSKEFVKREDGRWELKVVP